MAWVWMITAGALGIGYTLGQLYPTPAQRTLLATAGWTNPALVFLYSKLYGDSIGALTAWRYGEWAAASAPQGVVSGDDLCDSVDLILGEWAGQRPDLDFSAMAIVTRLARVHAHLQAGLADFQVIAHLRRAGSPYRMTQARLTSRLALTSGTVSLRIDRLVRRAVTRQ